MILVVSNGPPGPVCSSGFRLLFRTCCNCRSNMRLWRIEPKLTEHRVDTHFFECDKCGHATSEDIARPALG